MADWLLELSDYVQMTRRCPLSDSAHASLRGLVTQTNHTVPYCFTEAKLRFSAKL